MGLNDKVSLYASAPAITFEPSTSLGDAVSALLVLHKHRILVGRGVAVTGVVEPGDIPSLFERLGAGLWDTPLSLVAKARPPVVGGDTPVGEAAELMVRTGLSTLLVDLGGVTGVFTSWDVLQAIEPGELLTPVSEAAEGLHPRVSPDEPVEAGLEAMASFGRAIALVGVESPWGFLEPLSALKAAVEGARAGDAAEPIDVFTHCEGALSEVVAAMVDAATRVAVVHSGWKPLASLDEGDIVRAAAWSWRSQRSTG
ncbi:hypothetical protein APE_1510.1 [Aeropyrum pernix K1]|uniref:CBS domain-containing protein n=1 Tax=Aeropyrum pernix (strain ATCC 700893 / DSM 11879 / JCM 9820 / NBRC 100138 / K1) TaxID=272557 RepID=Q9YBT9_AERPE|nr:CBS domain-containing protein [Aeropyrum pernix]BAA80509.2 hypothetical protein APE_1510.1 [Aeropyrum pernix K1]